MKLMNCTKIDTCISKDCTGCPNFKPIKQPFNWELPVCLGLCVVWWIWLVSGIIKVFK